MADIPRAPLHQGQKRKRQVVATQAHNLLLSTLFVAPQSPFVPAPHIAPRSRGKVAFDTSGETPKVLFGDQDAPLFNRHTPLVQFRRVNADTSGETPKVLYGDQSAPFANSPQASPQGKGFNGDTSVGSPQQLLAVVGASPFFGEAFNSAKRRAQVLADTSAETPKVFFQDERFAPQDLAGVAQTPVKSKYLRDTSLGSPRMLLDVGSPITGTLATTNANDTVSASGTTTVVGTLARTNADDSVIASGWAGTITGTLATTNANDSVSAAGTVGSAVSTGAGSNKRRRRERYVVKHGDKYEVFSTPEEMQAYVEAAQAVEAPRPKKQRRPIRIELAPAFAEEVAAVTVAPKFNDKAPPSVALDQVRRLEKRLIELARQRREEEDEDDEVLLWLM